MGLPRLVVALALLGTLLAGAGALAAWMAQPPGDAGAFAVEVVGPGGARLFGGTVQVEEATALTLLLAAAEEGGFEVETREYPGMGTYVVAVAGHRAEGADGWVYEVRDGDAWVNGDRSAAHRPLQAGQALRWSWTDG